MDAHYPRAAIITAVPRHPQNADSSRATVMITLPRSVSSAGSLEGQLRPWLQFWLHGGHFMVRFTVTPNIIGYWLPRPHLRVERW